MSTPTPILELKGLTKTFGTFTAVDHIDLVINEGEFFTIVGVLIVPLCKLRRPLPLGKGRQVCHSHERLNRRTPLSWRPS